MVIVRDEAYASLLELREEQLLMGRGREQSMMRFDEEGRRRKQLHNFNSWWMSTILSGRWGLYVLRSHGGSNVVALALVARAPPPERGGRHSRIQLEQYRPYPF